MSFGAGDRKEVEGLMSKLTTTVDAMGRSRRDIQLVVRINPQWPDAVKQQLLGYVQLFDNLIGGLDVLENTLSGIIQAEHPLD